MPQSSTRMVDDGGEPALLGVRRGDFRADVEGMRAIAVLLVVIGHAKLGLLPGGFVGVDVFFVLSGFLITRLLVAEIRREGRIFLPDFWARRVRRLLPASTLTLVVVVVVTWLVVDPGMQIQTGADVVAAAAFVANWWFAAQATDYFGAAVDQSPVLHFWSLSVEEQYYLVWPPLLAGLLLVLRRRGHSSEHALQVAAVVLAGVAVASFAYSVRVTGAEPILGYYSTIGRAWELAVGGLLAIAVSLGVRLGARTALPVGYLGLAAVLGTAALLTADTAFPGWVAPLPVLGTAAVLLAGTGHSHGGHVGRWLGVTPMVRLGALSYSWYLWHWPFLVLAPYVVGELDRPTTVVVVLASLATAAGTFRLLENPVRRSPRLSSHVGVSLTLGATLIGTGLTSGMLLTRSATSSSSSSGITPVPALADRDLTQAHVDGCQLGYDEVTSPPCRYAHVGSEHVIVMLGDSHSTQWFPAVEPFASTTGAELVVLGKAACLPIGVTLWATRLDRPYTECDQWQQDAMARIAALPEGTVVLLSGRHDYRTATDEGARASRSTSDAEVAAGYARTVAALERDGKIVVPLRDGPLPPSDPARCVAANLDDPGVCDFPRPPASAGTPWEKTTLDAAGLRREVLDLNDAICAPSVCPAVVDQILRWRDEDHISATFAASLADEFAAGLRDALAASRRWSSPSRPPGHGSRRASVPPLWPGG